MVNVFQAKIIEKIKRRTVFSYIFTENGSVCEITWPNTVQPDRLHDNIIRYKHIYCWTPKLTVPKSEHALLFVFQDNNSYVNASHC